MTYLVFMCKLLGVCLLEEEGYMWRNKLKEILSFIGSDIKVRVLMVLGTIKNIVLFPFRKINQFRKWIGRKIRRTQWKITKAYRTVTGCISHYRWEILFFLHTTLSAGLIIWGLEEMLPFTVWKFLIGVYLGLWIGLVYLVQVFKIGIYIGQKKQK